MRRRYIFKVVSTPEVEPYSRRRLRRRCARYRAVGARLFVRQNGEGPIWFYLGGANVIAYPYTERRPRGR